ncbi:hypothetical protein GLOTRDRAFT_97416 [Gloeophyllum trabeum ATCC 11539]|uniref:MARVEL domain-containing protein n=1 Tax=Gloeophyllum trabeum (strain ATCC 11539 / FP-39264 / Madison 617) TaxID=670483 RepID=S7QL59_GLOTA|nr:uncharacterized protein GLOTRDRAFT_97416 [Gloeophyllum trabeum ATCC 11539]EPQ60013.1 hypothetical protein GLOTRDRAFT_97416 [Gloeophyllum trabeum ATCC 11539]
MSSADVYVRRGHPVLFGLIIFFGIVELALSAWLTSRYNAHHNYPSGAVRDRSRFLLFASIWTVVISPAYMGLFLASSAGSIFTSIASHFIFLLLSWVFWLAGAASLTAALGGGLSCHLDATSYCGQLNAEEGFAWIQFIMFTLALIFVLARGISVSRAGDGLRGQLVSTA